MGFRSLLSTVSRSENVVSVSRCHQFGFPALPVQFVVDDLVFVATFCQQQLLPVQILSKVKFIFCWLAVDKCFNLLFVHVLVTDGPFFFSPAGS